MTSSMHAAPKSTHLGLPDSPPSQSRPQPQRSRRREAPARWTRRRSCCRRIQTPPSSRSYWPPGLYWHLWKHSCQISTEVELWQEHAHSPLHLHQKWTQWRRGRQVIKLHLPHLHIPVFSVTKKDKKQISEPEMSCFFMRRSWESKYTKYSIL